LIRISIRVLGEDAGRAAFPGEKLKDDPPILTARHQRRDDWGNDALRTHIELTSIRLAWRDSRARTSQSRPILLCLAFPRRDAGGEKEHPNRPANELRQRDTATALNRLVCLFGAGAANIMLGQVAKLVYTPERSKSTGSISTVR